MINAQSTDDRSDENTIDAALGLIGFGKFSIKVITIGGLIFLNAACFITCISFIFPAAACDFKLSSVDNGIMITVFMTGMLGGAYFWGCLANLIGRKYTLVIALFSQGCFGILSSLISNYSGYLIFQFFTGFSTNGQITVIFPYIGEFQSTKVRQIALTLMEITWTLGMMLPPVIGWAIIPLEISYIGDYFFFHSWNLFVLLCAVPAPLLSFWLLTFPETPKYLSEFGDDSQLTTTLQTMYLQNTGKPFTEFLEKLKNEGYNELHARLTTQRTKKEQQRVSRCEQIKKMIANIIRETLTILKPPYLKNTLLICAIMFCNGSADYAMTLWFPELFKRFAKFEEEFPNESISVCTVVTPIPPGNSSNMISKCPAAIPTEVYVHTLIVGAACLPVNVLVSLTVNKLGLKFFLVIPSVISSAVTVGFFFVKSSTENLILSATFEAFTSIIITIVLSIIVELYPTSVRVMASTFGLLMVRMGAIAGNLLMGYLIDKYCAVIITIIAVQFLLCAVLGLLIPLKRHKQ